MFPVPRSMLLKAYVRVLDCIADLTDSWLLDAQLPV